MRRTAVLFALTCMICGGLQAQDKGKDKAIRFSNITEATVGFQLGKTTQVTSMAGTESTIGIAGFKIPSPRFTSSFGAMFWNLFFIGPGIGYMYQAADANNPLQHHLSAYGHLRLHFSKGRFRPYTEIKGGYTHIFPQDVVSIYSSETYTWDGAFAEPAIGLGLKLGAHGQLNASLGYQFLDIWNRSKGLTSTSAFGPEIEHNYHRLLLSLGFSFF